VVVVVDPPVVVVVVVDVWAKAALATSAAAAVTKSVLMGFPSKRNSLREAQRKRPPLRSSPVHLLFIVSNGVNPPRLGEGMSHAPE
jgi:hypothetical protein